MKSLIFLVTFLLSVLTLAQCRKCRVVKPMKDNVKKIDFFKGVDLSSIISVENSGVKFYDQEGKEDDIFKILKDNGVNTIRVRIWNDPKNSTGQYYGGGNCDLEVAKKIGQRAAKQDLAMLINFHYSDFWADPQKQTPPKAWEGFTIPEMGKAIHDYTYNSLKYLLKNGVKIAMVQVGNENNDFMCGSKDMKEITSMMEEGIKAVREVNPDILVGLHFSNPEKKENFLRYAEEANRLNYDVFITSYYTYWHGDFDNLNEVLMKVAEYGRPIVIGETAYPYVNELSNPDGYSYGMITNQTQYTDFRYPFTVEGQADALRDVFKAIKKIPKGSGVFYWEPAWLSLELDTDLERQKVWEANGSGWASTAAHGYDKDVDGTVTGGTTWENQALFDQHGKALKSLAVYNEF